MGDHFGGVGEEDAVHSPAVSVLTDGKENDEKDTKKHSSNNFLDRMLRSAIEKDTDSRD